MSGDLKLLCRATCRVYGASLIKSWRGYIANWYLALFPVVYFILLMPVFFIAGLFGQILGGFILGLTISLLVANYLTLVSEAVDGGKLLLREIWPKTLELFLPVIGVSFLLYVLNLLAITFFGQRSPWMISIISLVVILLFNPLPEALYHRRGRGTEAFVESLEFIKENWIEWFVPHLIIILPLLLAFAPQEIFLMFAQADPLRIVIFFFQSYLVSALSLNFGLVPVYIICLSLSYFIMIFRGVLYQELSTSSRRKRIYQERNA